ncbi:MAG: PD-(D/E)XK nuclease family protein [Candidatus Atabeyarchaeum deiterrae]
MEVKQSSKEIVRKRITHRNVTYLFQWNRTNHRSLISDPSLHDLASPLWNFLERVCKDEIPHHYFLRDDFKRASAMRLSNTSKSAEASLTYSLAKESLIKPESYSELLKLVRKVVSSSSSHGSVLSYLLNFDPYMVASEVPVYSEDLKLTGHIDLVRLRSDHKVQVLDFKPDLRDANLVLAIPQVAAYGILLNGLIPSADNQIECVVFNTRESISFRPDLIKAIGYLGNQLFTSGNSDKKMLQHYQTTLDSLLR